MLKKLSTVMSHTQGYTLSETSPALPTDVPYASDVASSTRTANLVFQTPSTHTQEFSNTPCTTTSLSPDNPNVIKKKKF